MGGDECASQEGAIMTFIATAPAGQLAHDFPGQRIVSAIPPLLPKPLAMTRRPVLDHLMVAHAPVDAYRRYVRMTEQALARRNMHLSLIDPIDLMTANDANIATWEALMPALDARQNAIAHDEMITFALCGPKGDLIATVATRLFQVELTLKQAFESLWLLYGDGAPAKRAVESFQLTAPSAAVMRGRIAYRGGFWVRPDLRRSALPRILARLARVAAMAAWQPDHHIGIGTEIFELPHIQDAYGIARTERSFSYERHGQLHWQGVLTLTDHASAGVMFAADLRALEDDML
jgi:hypothetical protein